MEPKHDVSTTNPTAGAPRRRTHRELLPRDLCPHLMMKQILVHGLDQTIFDDRQYPGDGYHWCQRTCTPVGPDDELADIDVCRPGRGCFGGVTG
ncbi:MAG: hypothetical protein IPM29_01135 [Planctomycetes bacterium]|nr:hypothetical protein [Planctomycetota bacterium]